QITDRGLEPTLGELALSNDECQQRCVENFAKRSEVEERIRSERTFRRLIGHASIKEQRATADPNGDGCSARFLWPSRQFPCNDFLHAVRASRLAPSRLSGP